MGLLEDFGLKQRPRENKSIYSRRKINKRRMREADNLRFDEDGYQIKRGDEEYIAPGHQSGLKEGWRYSSLVILAGICLIRGIYVPMLIIIGIFIAYIFAKKISEARRNQFLEEQQMEDEEDDDPYKDGFYGYNNKLIQLGDDEEEYKR